MVDHTALPQRNSIQLLLRSHWKGVSAINCLWRALTHHALFLDTVALPNYTGSVGFGQSFVLRLIGKCGSLDVEDCIQSLHHLVDLGYARLGKGRVFIFGGSHGGFLGAHCMLAPLFDHFKASLTKCHIVLGQFQDIFTAAVLRNPVISVGEISTSDIPDWYYAEFGIQYPSLSLALSSRDVEPSGDGGVSPGKNTAQLGMTPNVYQKLYDASPICVAHNVTADVLLLVGRDDLRVAPTQGYGYYHTLRAVQNAKGAAERGRVEMLVFDGESHPLNGVECERTSWEAAKAWFAQSAGKGKDKE